MDLNIHSIVKGIQELQNFVDNTYEPYMKELMREVYAIKNNINSLYNISIYPESSIFTESNVTLDRILKYEKFTDIRSIFTFELNSPINNTVTLVNINAINNKVDTNLDIIPIPAYITEPISRTIFNVNIWSSEALNYPIKLVNNNNTPIKFNIPFVNIERIENNSMYKSVILDEKIKQYTLTELTYIGKKGIAFDNNSSWILPKLNYLQPELIYGNAINEIDLSGSNIKSIPSNTFVNGNINTLLLPNSLVKIYGLAFNNLKIRTKLEIPFFVQIENNSCNFDIVSKNFVLSLLVGDKVNINNYVLWLNDKKSGFDNKPESNPLNKDFITTYSENPYLNVEIISMYIPSTNINMRIEN